MKNLYAVIFAGLPHVYREYMNKPVDEVAGEVREFCDWLTSLGIPTDHTPEAEAACRAAFQYEDLRRTVEIFWMMYDRGRKDGSIPPATRDTWEP